MVQGATKIFSSSSNRFSFQQLKKTVYRRIKIKTDKMFIIILHMILFALPELLGNTLCAMWILYFYMQYACCIKCHDRNSMIYLQLHTSQIFIALQITYHAVHVTIWRYHVLQMDFLLFLRMKYTHFEYNEGDDNDDVDKVDDDDVHLLEYTYHNSQPSGWYLVIIPN